MSWELTEATPPIDSPILFTILILILLFCNFIYLLNHYMSLLFFKSKLNKFKISNIDKTQHQKSNCSMNSRSILFNEIINIITQSKLTGKNHLNSQLDIIKYKIKYHFLKKYRTLFFPIVAFLLSIIDILMKLISLHSVLMQSKTPPNLFDLLNMLIIPIFVVVSCCFINLMFSIWIIISAKLNSEKIIMQLGEINSEDLRSP